MHADVLAGVSLLAFCAVAFYATTLFREVPAMLSQNVPPTFFPRVILGAIGVLAGTLIVSGLRREREPRRAFPTTIAGTAVVFLVTVSLIQFVGMLAALGFAAAVLPLYWGERRYSRVALFAICLPAAIYVIFSLTLGLRLPIGIFG